MPAPAPTPMILIPTSPSIAPQDLAAPFAGPFVALPRLHTEPCSGRLQPISHQPSPPANLLPQSRQRTRERADRPRRVPAHPSSPACRCRPGSRFAVVPRWPVLSHARVHLGIVRLSATHPPSLLRRLRPDPRRLFHESRSTLMPFSTQGHSPRVLLPRHVMAQAASRTVHKHAPLRLGNVRGCPCLPPVRSTTSYEYPVSPSRVGDRPDVAAAEEPSRQGPTGMSK